MTFYLDTSFLISALTDESNSQASRDWLKAGGDPTIISDFAALELGASVSRFVRTGRLAEAPARALLARFDRMRSASASHAHDKSDFDLADEIVRDFDTKLAAPDALHLAATVNLRARLVTYDERLAAAARLRGLQVVSPG
ncbi:MAG: type II toxin-antitoxin system VapC family toxin [Beijerinckiaceae bacterium]